MRSTRPRALGREVLESFVVAIVLALFIRTFLVQAFKIPTSSMEENLQVGDQLLVNKLIYSPTSGVWEDVLLGKRAPRRGDVVVFKYPEDPSRDFIKRVVGLPGETVRIANKRVYIDERPLDEPYVHFLQPPLPETHAGQELTDPTSQGEWGPQRVPAGRLFVMGDNRDNSRDSRYWGFLPSDQVRGRAVLVYASFAPLAPASQGAGWRQSLAALTSLATRTRWERFCHFIR
jgi:signal peptidase I